MADGEMTYFPAPLVKVTGLKVIPEICDNLIISGLNNQH
jgi:hypothetical protein